MTSTLLKHQPTQNSINVMVWKQSNLTLSGLEVCDIWLSLGNILMFSDVCHRIFLTKISPPEPRYTKFEFEILQDNEISVPDHWAFQLQSYLLSLWRSSDTSTVRRTDEIQRYPLKTSHSFSSDKFMKQTISPLSFFLIQKTAHGKINNSTSVESLESTLSQKQNNTEHSGIARAASWRCNESKARGRAESPYQLLGTQCLSCQQLLTIFESTRWGERQNCFYK